MNAKILVTLRNIYRAAPAVLATGIVSTSSLAASGDLDPGFADVGRLVLPDLPGPAASVAAQDDDIILAGGKIVPDFDSEFDDEAAGFARRLSGIGALDATFAAAGLDEIMVVDLEVQADGKIVGVGRRNPGGGLKPVAFRLEPDGSLDAGFGQEGVAELTGITHVHSIAADPGGTIVIAATFRGDGNPFADAKVLRLLSTGDPDDSFGSEGAFTISADIEEFYIPSHILSAGNGGYRVAVNQFNFAFSGCRVLALTTSGSVDWSAELDDESECNSMAESPDGELLIAGSDPAGPFVTRLLAGGAVDPAFDFEPLADTSLDVATDVAVDPNTGSIVVVFDETGGGQEPAVLVARLQPDGALDPLFGDGGATWVDLPEIDGHATYATPGDVTVLGNSDVLVSGGEGSPFVARLVGGSGSDSPGVLGVRNIGIETAEDTQEAIVTVRRMGGKAGSVSVAYETQATPGDVFQATEGEDFTAVSGRLEWADGDTADKQIVVPIAPDDGSPEESEQFAVRISDAEGGAGAGTSETTVVISSDATSAGMFSIETPEVQAEEFEGIAFATISRGYSYDGPVSVTVTMASGTATAGEDFDSEPVTVSWADGDHFQKTVSIPITDDSSDEPQEQFTLQLSDATGGAVIGPRANATVSIADDDEAAPPPPPPDGGGGGGGGPVGFVSLLLLGIARLAAITRRAYGLRV